MKKGQSTYLLLSTLVMLITASCSNTRHIAGDQLLYTGRNKIIIEGPEALQHQKEAKQVIRSATSYKPNNSLGNKRVLPPIGLWTYNYLKPKGDGKLANWLYRRFMDEPVLVSQVNPELRSLKVKSDLFNIGFFSSAVSATIDTSRNNPQKAKISYYVRLDHPYRYNSITFEPPVDEVDSIIYGYQELMDIRPGEVFDLAAIKNETKNITGLITEKGYFFFRNDHLQLIADTLAVPKQIDLRISKKRDLPPAVIRKYTIDDIHVMVSNPEDTADQTADTLYKEGIAIVSPFRYLKPELITTSIFFRSGDLYSYSGHQQTLQRLNSYGIFRNVTVQFIPDADSTAGKLDMKVELTLLKNISLDIETDLLSKSTGFAGPGFTASFNHNNLAGRASKLQIKLNGGFEWQWNKTYSSSLGTNSYNFGLKSAVVVPRMLLPFYRTKPDRYGIPRTSVNAGFDYLNKIRYYRMSSLNLSLGYQFKRSAQITHIIYPVFLNSVTLLRTTAEFDSILNSNLYIRKSFEEQFIAGLKYEFIYDNPVKNQPHDFYFHLGVSSAGNALNLFKIGSSEPRPYKVLNNVYSQFLKFSADIRYYGNLHDQGLVFRLYAGVGTPYGNSTVMPYIEQFFSGGANSIRAFSARSLGPGSYEAASISGIIDQTGDIKLEGNMEYRFKMSGVLYGALFLDAGNVWLLNRDENRPGAEFRSDSFAGQLAVGTGIGLRFDFNFFVLRTDFGFPLRRPYPVKGNQWIRSGRDFFSGALNLAIGYPF